MRDVTALLAGVQGGEGEPRSLSVGELRHVPGAPPSGGVALPTSLSAVGPSLLPAFFQDRADQFREWRKSGEDYHKSRQVSRVLARRRVARHVREYEEGLSNTAYLAATSGTQNIRLAISPARVRVTLSDPLADLPLSGPVAGGGRRGVVREFSDAARDRLADRAAELQALDKVPDSMVTLTSPANWEEIYMYDPETGEALDGGRIFKGHLHAFRKRLTRFLGDMGVSTWGALWFLEFQERGAPHAHLILFDCNLTGEQRRVLRAWVGRAWSSVVGNPSKIEKGKHQRAGTQVAKMKKKHFGYAQKYASKMAQKCVPDGFEGVGRFWGVWNCKKSAPVVLDLDFSRFDEQERLKVEKLLYSVLATIYPHSPAFYESRMKRVLQALYSGIKHKTGFSVYGPPAAQAALSGLQP